MYDYVTTKPELNEETLSEFGITIQHGYLKDAAAKVHKYIKRWKNEAGKWVYQYKKPKSNLTFVSDQASKELVGDGGFVNRYDKGHKTAARREYIKRANDIWRARNGYRKTSKSAMKGDSRYKRSKTNLRDQGYSSSQGSGESKRLSNLGTRKMYNSKYNKAGYKNPSGGKVNPYYFEEKRLQSMSKKQMKNGYKVETYNVSKTKKKKK